MNWPLETVRLYDANQWPVETWEGWMVPPLLDLWPNSDARISYVLEIGDPGHWRRVLTVGSLHEVVWEALERYSKEAA